MWRSDSCYGSYGVDGSTCSFFIYLSEVTDIQPPFFCSCVEGRDAVGGCNDLVDKILKHKHGCFTESCFCSVAMACTSFFLPVVLNEPREWRYVQWLRARAQSLYLG